MRHTVCFEGSQEIPGWYVVANSMSWEDRIPIVMSFDYGKQVGWTWRLNREDDGRITAELEFFDNYEKLLFNKKGELNSLYNISWSAFPVESHIWKKHRWITKARIRDIAIVPNGGNPRP